MASKTLGFLKSKKARPFVIGGVVIIGGILVFMMFRGGGSSGGQTVVQSGPSENMQLAQIQAGVQMAGIQAQSNVEATRLATELQAFITGANRDITIAGLQADVAQRTLDSQTAIQLAGIGAQENIAIQQEATARYGMQVQGQIQTAGIVAQENIAFAQYDFLRHQETQRTTTELARINADVAMNQANQKTQRKGQTLGFIGSVIGGIASIFSDVRLKRGLNWTGQSVERQPRGFLEHGRFEYDTILTPGRVLEYGVIAQEIAQINPNAVVASRSNRFLMVDYSAV